MTDFWIGAVPLFVMAAAFLLIPLRRRSLGVPEDIARTWNVALYQAHLADWDVQHHEGRLSEADWAQARSEAGHRVLDDTASALRVSSRRLFSRFFLVLLAFLVPVSALLLYQEWSSYAALALTRELAKPPTSLDEQEQRLVRATQLQPTSGANWYLLGRFYMAQNRPVDAVRPFEHALRIFGRQPELLGQLIQARYFAASGANRWSSELQQLADEALRADPREPTVLGLAGIAAFEAHHFEAAVDLWSRLLVQIPPSDPAHQSIQSGIERARAQLGAQQISIAVEVRLSPEVQAKTQPTDSVFVFIQAPKALPMPLAIKRLQVSDLPALVRFSDADALLPQLALSAFDSVRVGARVSKAGDARRGEWVGYLVGLTPQKAAAPVVLVVDQANSEAASLENSVSVKAATE